MLFSIQHQASLCDGEARGCTTRVNELLTHLAQRYVAPFTRAVILFEVKTAEIGFGFGFRCYTATLFHRSSLCHKITPKPRSYTWRE